MAILLRSLEPTGPSGATDVVTLSSRCSGNEILPLSSETISLRLGGGGGYGSKSSSPESTFIISAGPSSNSSSEAGALRKNGASARLSITTSPSMGT